MDLGDTYTQVQHHFTFNPEHATVDNDQLPEKSNLNETHKFNLCPSFESFFFKYFLWSNITYYSNTCKPRNLLTKTPNIEKQIILAIV